MNPIYKFELDVNGNSQIAKPIWRDDLSLEFVRESGQQFYRKNLSGDLVFVDSDFARIEAAAFDTKFVLNIYISYDDGGTWAAYWRGVFWKTDCKFDGDSQTVTATPEILDMYNDVLAGLDKEYNLIDLSPVIIPVKADKRPCIQIYIPGQTSIGCFLSGMWWEEECENISNESDLVSKYKFLKNAEMRILAVSGNMEPEMSPAFVLKNPPAYNFDTNDGTYRIRYYPYTEPDDASMIYSRWEISLMSSNVVLWRRDEYNTYPKVPPYSVTLQPVAGEGEVVLDVSDIPVYGRWLCDVEDIGGVSTYPIPDDDLCMDNRNYHRILGDDFSSAIFFGDGFSADPTEWGIYQPGMYYIPPVVQDNPELFPVARNIWGRVSVWFAALTFFSQLETVARREFIIRHAYPIYSVISVLLNEIAPGITHDATIDYSEFLYSTNIIGIEQHLMITPKSNILTAGYDQPASKAPITLGEVLEMLRDCFRCYWYIDSQNRFRIEHIEYFRNGGSYSGTPVVGIDLTNSTVERNGKAWSFGTDKYQFDKPEMEARYQFGWMDDVTRYFEGEPIDIVSQYVNLGNVKNIDIVKFTSDIDYILLSPSAISKDGFVLMGGIPASETDGETVQAYANIHDFFQFDIAKYEEQELTIRVISDTAGITLYQSRLGTARIQIGTVALANTYYTFTFTVQPGKNVISFYANTDYRITLLSVFAEKPTRLQLPYISQTVNNNVCYLQNGYVAFPLLQNYYLYDMPARRYSINGTVYNAIGVKRLKYQTLNFPAITDPDLMQLIKTNLGNGTIRKISLNLSSRKAETTLEYDTE